MDRQLSKSERTRQFIIETTAPIFNTKGYAGTSMSDLTDATRLTKGSIYGNFENKEEVALAAFDHNLCIIRQSTATLLAKAQTYHQKLMVYAKVYHSFTRGTFPEGGCPILNTAIEADDTNNQLRDKAAKALLTWKKNLETLIQQGIAAGEFKTEIDQQQLALSIIALIEGGIMIAKLTGHSSSLNQVLKTVEQLIDQITL